MTHEAEFLFVFSLPSAISVPSWLRMTTSTLMLTIGAVLAIGVPCHAGKLPQAERLRSEAYQKLHPDKKITPVELQQAKQSIERLAAKLSLLEAKTADPTQKQHLGTQQRFCEQLSLNLDTIVRRSTIHATLPDETFTALHFAVCLGLIDVAEMLMQHGADPNALLDPSSERPLWYACRWDQPESIRLLLKYGANPDDIDAQGTTCLFEADPTEARILIEEGKAKLQTTSRSPMHLPSVLHGACSGDVPWTHTQMKDRTCRRELFRDKVNRDRINPGYVRYLIEKGCDVNLGNGTKGTPLHRAVDTNLPDIAEILLQHGADPNATDEHGTTPLLIAAKYGDSGIGKLLLQYKANPSKADKNGKTPLYQAISQNATDDQQRLEMAELLLQSKADPNAADEQGTTPLHLAARADDLPLARLLLHYKADPSLRTQKGKTPADEAGSNAMKALLTSPTP